MRAMREEAITIQVAIMLVRMSEVDHNIILAIEETPLELDNRSGEQSALWEKVYAALNILKEQSNKTTNDIERVQTLLTHIIHSGEDSLSRQWALEARDLIQALCKKV